MNKKEMNNKGFSLVELIIVIAIMAILVGVLAPQFIKYVERSRVSTDMQNAQAIRTAIEAYVADAGSSDANTDDPTADITVTVTGGAGGTMVIANCATNADLGGTELTTNLRSGNWTGNVTFTYDCFAGAGDPAPTFTWSSGSVATYPNGTADMCTVF